MAHLPSYACMTKLAVLVLLAACGGGTKSTPTTTPPPTTTTVAPPETPPEPKARTYKAGPSAIPIPLDADDGTPAPGAAMMTIFKIPRGKLVVVEELRGLLKEVGWQIVGEETSPRGAIRLECQKAGETPVMLRLTGDETQTALIVQPQL
jgi:hypothetical protein